MVHGARYICGIRYEFRGMERVPTDQPVIFAVKHQSAWETLVFNILLQRPCYVLKKELLTIPIFGNYMKRSWNIVVDRNGSVSALKQLVQKVTHSLERNLSIIIFPEGTRVPLGTAGKYHPGIAAIYTSTNAPVIPVAVNSGLFWPRNSFLKRPGTVVMEFLDPIPSGLKRPEFMQALENAIETATRRLEQEGLAKLEKAERAN
ncbi:MAG: 1-acyl-sn-glycerol-3-phosphate acyltransferase [Hyphomicrobiales bacterium]|nr:1-acyl-sn-glycerol-3-phosphate acyltransferase [Rickettsiales bacterium]MCP5361281.1 1-acyl-sn-glycerol-3-phosphate acyltransferase [Hyphomicrobiales bacterium]